VCLVVSYFLWEVGFNTGVKSQDRNGYPLSPNNQPSLIVLSSNFSQSVDLDQIKASCVPPGHLATMFRNRITNPHDINRMIVFAVHIKGVR
jgi:hypothetical protein